MKLYEISSLSQRHSPQLTRDARRETTGDRGNRWRRARFWDHQLPVISLSRWRVSTRRQTPIYLRQSTTSSYPFDLSSFLSIPTSYEGSALSAWRLYRHPSWFCQSAALITSETAIPEQGHWAASTIDPFIKLERIWR